MKRNSLFVLVFAFWSSIFSINFASAAYFPSVRSLSQSVVDSYVDVGEPILQALFGGYGGWSGFLLFERFLIFLLLVAIVYVVIGRVPLFQSQKTVRWVVAIVVPLISMRFVNYDQITALMQQYQLLAIVLSSALPFLIFFYFVHSIGGDYPIMRKVLWIFFMAVYAGLWTTTASDSQSTIFFWTLVAAVIFLIFDKRIEMYISAKEFAKRERWSINSKIADINDRISKINDQVVKGTHPNPKEARKEIRELELQKSYLNRQI